MRKVLEDVLKTIATLFNEAELNWAVGASLVLYHNGIVDKVNDIDIVIEGKDVKKAEELLLTLGTKQFTKEIPTYSNEYFGEFDINGVEIDMMSEMVINNHNCSYPYPFDQKSVVSHMALSGVNIPVSSLEEWFILYQMIPNKEVKVDLLNTYFKNHDILYPELLKRGLDADLPEHIKESINRLLDKTKEK
ncbi:MAG: hypothetical protein JEZ08_03745 [Clostridiales bacterium]|nr:hypothetical protein [Clostridiales bacterium]